ncbi:MULTISPECIES: hypothetical protein [Leuconostoc]|jgi:hypothetical protein|uniref:hypothetical protein n=1 Tax=Leuconostoc TaxID=1243 RepID=UPI000E0965D6|nr:MULTISPECIES: hypothetical protein [Leuconostoc]MBZ1505976.1 hypothetical protein [Leuconostoc mesenteroides]MCH3952000.1 hypothetical protein [Leuconostoc mesenteroides]MDP0487162.1 hypothetical protein [Leuconostoc mesenteroides]RDF91635.1 hypothetical protein DQM09_06435 [Leuconostoc mesenteroides subsp. mesenteroides]
MNKDEIVEKVKSLMSEGNLDKAKDFIEEHKEDLGENFDKLKGMIGDNAEGVIGKIKGLFDKK